MSPTTDQLAEKLNELIAKHNDLAHAVQNLVDALEIINETVLGSKDKTLDS